MSEPFIPVCEPTFLGNEIAYVSEAMETGWISSSGKYVGQFESTFAQYCETRYGVAVCNGTVALHLALEALGIGEGDEVIIPCFTMIATAAAVCYTGARPVFVDAHSETWNIDTSRIEEKITERTRALLPVHIMGYPCDMDELGTIAKKHGLPILEDAAEAHGALWKGRKAGSFGTLAAFSFFGNKNLTTGEGGMVVTNDESLYDRCRYLKNLAFPLQAAREYLHEDIGFNYRMSNLHAAIGLAQVEKADDYRSRRIHNHSMYREMLKDVPGILHQYDPEYGPGQASSSTGQLSAAQNDSLHVHWMNAICIDPEQYGRNRDDLMSLLRDKGIDSRKLFTGMHRQPGLAKFGCDMFGDFPVTEYLAENGLYLPSGSSLREEQIERICSTIRDGARK